MAFNGLEVNIDRSDNNYFILEEEINELFINLGYGKDSQLLSGLDIRKIEQLVNNNPAARVANAYTTVDGKLKIDIKQRIPLLRVFSKSGSSFYLDELGEMMPLSEKFTARVLIANGNIEDKDSLNDLFQLAKFIRNNEFWNAQVTQIYINAENEIELITRVGNQVVLFGDVSDMEEKFGKLMIFYKMGLKKTGWNLYSHINLKFKNQVVCIKNQ